MKETQNATGTQPLRIWRLNLRRTLSWYQERLGILFLVVSLLIGGYLLLNQTKTTQITYKEDPPNPNTKISTKSKSISATSSTTKTAKPSSPSATPGQIVSLNTGTATQLDSLPGIGPSTAQKIIDYRSRNGPFKTLEQLQNVAGIGPVKFAKLQGLISL